MTSSSITAKVYDLAQLLHAEVDNPMDGVSPNFTAFGVEFTKLWQKLLAGLWGIVLVFIIGYLILSFAQMLSSSGNDPRKVKESRGSVTNAVIALGGCIALPIIVGAAITIFG